VQDDVNVIDLFKHFLGAAAVNLLKISSACAVHVQPDVAHCSISMYEVFFCRFFWIQYYCRSLRQSSMMFRGSPQVPTAFSEFFQFVRATQLQNDFFFRFLRGYTSAD